MPEEANEQAQPKRPRPIWSGNIAFGLVNLPVHLFAATRPRPVSLRMVDEAGTPLTRRYFCPKDAQALTAEDIVRGYETEPDRFVLVEDEELDAAAPEKSREIDLRRFVPVAEIDPTYFQRAYFLTPDGAVKAYRLLARSMEEAGRAGIATFVMRGKEYVVAILAERGILRAETLRFQDELRSPADVGLPEREQADADRVRALRKAIDGLGRKKLDRDALEDRQSQRLLDRIREKHEAGEDVVSSTKLAEAEQETGEDESPVDLMTVLKESLGQAEERESQRNGKTQEPDRGLSKAALYERAKALGIPGRSKMSRAELLDAIGER